MRLERGALPSRSVSLSEIADDAARGGCPSSPANAIFDVDASRTSAADLF